MAFLSAIIICEKDTKVTYKKKKHLKETAAAFNVLLSPLRY